MIFQQTGGNQNFALIRSKGDQALFGKTTQQMKAHWNVPDARPLADFAPTIILKAKDFATEITIFNARQHVMTTESTISNEHVTNNDAVRKTLLQRGIRPESLPAAEDVKKVERRLSSRRQEVASEPRLPRRLTEQVNMAKKIKPTARAPATKQVVTLTHTEASRKNIPTAEYESVMAKETQSPVRVAYERRNRDLDPQLVWRGKDEQDWSDLVVQAPPLFIQEKLHPKALIDDLQHQSEAARIAKKLASGVAGGFGEQIDLFADFNGLPDNDAKTEFYQHDAHWANRMILGDSLQVMASLAEREGLRGKVQCIYIDPPYGIKFNSNFQWSTTSRDVKDGNADHITREPEQVKAFRDTWRDGIHSYLTYLRDRLMAARDLLADSGSIFVQIGDENVHVVKCLLDEIFGTGGFRSLITFTKTSGQTDNRLASVADYILWYGKSDITKYRQLYLAKDLEGAGEAFIRGSWKRMAAAAH